MAEGREGRVRTEPEVPVPTATVTHPAADPARSSAPPRSAFGHRRLLVTLTAAVVAAGVLAVLGARYWNDRHSLDSIRPQGIPANVTTQVANMMGLDALGSRPPAPGFTLTDQEGRTVSLRSFRGHPVVLNFMDPHCTDICPIVSQELVDAQHELAAVRPDTVFLAVNVNKYHGRVADVAAFSRVHQLDSIPTWHFLTGPLPVLRRIWSDYGVSVDARGPNADVVHSSLTYFIGPTGKERFLASPWVDHTQAGSAYLPTGTVASWGRGIADVAADLAR